MKRVLILIISGLFVAGLIGASFIYLPKFNKSEQLATISEPITQSECPSCPECPKCPEYIPAEPGVVIKEVIKEVPVIKEIIREVPVEKIVVKEVIKEVPVANTCQQNLDNMIRQKEAEIERLKNIIKLPDGCYYTYADLGGECINEEKRVNYQGQIISLQMNISNLLKEGCK